jgi:adenylosuccinate synthase
MRNIENNSTAVIGLQYGDEGKGQIVDLLSSENDIVVRYNGGANAGHSVAIGNEKYVLHQIPIGVLTPGRINVL